jgi:hypothetical protein
MVNSKILVSTPKVGIFKLSYLKEYTIHKLDGSDGARYILRYDRSRDEWEIQMMESPPSTG